MRGPLPALILTVLLAGCSGETLRIPAAEDAARSDAPAGTKPFP